jgi:hypothetical protein
LDLSGANFAKRPDNSKIGESRGWRRTEAHGGPRKLSPGKLSPGKLSPGNPAPENSAITHVSGVAVRALAAEVLKKSGA